MIHELYDIQLDAGARFEPIGDVMVVASFGNDPQAIQAARQGVAIVDLSHWGRLLVLDDDRLRYLHNQSTNDFQRLKPGEGCDTVFVTSTARTIDLVTAYVTEDAVLLLVSPNRRQQLLDWLDRYIFPMDRVELKDVSSETATFTLIGPESDRLLQNLGVSLPIGENYAIHKQLMLGEIQVRVAVGSGLALPGYTLIVAAEDAGKLWKLLQEAGAKAIGDRLWEQLRIEQGRPVPDQELTDEYNPLEAGLWQTISLEKGC